MGEEPLGKVPPPSPLLKTFWIWGRFFVQIELLTCALECGILFIFIGKCDNRETEITRVCGKRAVGGCETVCSGDVPLVPQQQM